MVRVGLNKSLIEHPVIPFDPKSNAPKEVPNFNHFTIILGDSFPEQGLLPIKVVIIVRFNPTKFMHKKCGPSPRPSCLNTKPKFMFDRFARVKAKDTLLGDRGWCDPSPPFVDCNSFVPN